MQYFRLRDNLLNLILLSMLWSSTIASVFKCYGLVFEVVRRLSSANMFVVRLVNVLANH